MRIIKVLFVAVIAAFVLGLTVTTHPASAQGSLPACTDKTNFGTILSAMSQGPFADAFSKIADAATPDDFANILDLGIQTRTVVMALSINPTNPTDQGCFYLQLSSLTLLNDELDVATYQSFIKAGLKNADAYQKGLADAQARLTKDSGTFQALAQASIATPAATTAP
jgi:hypothetical protein